MDYEGYFPLHVLSVFDVYEPKLQILSIWEMKIHFVIADLFQWFIFHLFTCLLFAFLYTRIHMLCKLFEMNNSVSVANKSNLKKKMSIDFVGILVWYSIFVIIILFNSIMAVYIFAIVHRSYIFLFIYFFLSFFFLDLISWKSHFNSVLVTLCYYW